VSDSPTPVTAAATCRRQGRSLWTYPFAVDLSQGTHLPSHRRGDSLPALTSIPTGRTLGEPPVLRDGARDRAAWWEATVDLDARAQLSEDMAASVAYEHMATQRPRPRSPRHLPCVSLRHPGC
jgi:hypothetical protein